MTTNDQLPADQEIRKAALTAAVGLFIAALDLNDQEDDLIQATQTVIEFAHNFELFIRDGYKGTSRAAEVADINSYENVAARLVDMGLAEGGTP